MTRKKTKIQPVGNNAGNISEWIRRLEGAHPDAGQALESSSPLELLVALILAAQCTDERVNQVTRSLFQKYRTAADYGQASQEVMEQEIRSTGFFRNKARAIRECCAAIEERFQGEVPDRLEDLVILTGVGRKTANIVLGNAFGVQAIGVDTHVKRLAGRMGFSAHGDPDRIEEDLCGIVPRNKWVRFCHLLQFHGRRVCKARKPKCDTCPMEDLCPKIGV